MSDLHYKGKASPAFGLLYDTTGDTWNAFTSNINIGVSGMDFKNAPQPQKATAQHLFVYDTTIENWRPMSVADLGAQGTSLTGASESVTSGSVLIEISGLELDAVPTFINTTLTRPTSGAAIIFSSVRADSVTTGGFIADFSAQIPETGYSLSYILNI